MLESGITLPTDIDTTVSTFVNFNSNAPKLRADVINSVNPPPKIQYQSNMGNMEKRVER